MSGPPCPASSAPGRRPAVTDAQGRFTFAGVGRGLNVFLSIRDPRFAQQGFDLMAEAREAGKELTPALHPAKIIEGRVLAADTGRPDPGRRDLRAVQLRDVRPDVHDAGSAPTVRAGSRSILMRAITSACGPSLPTGQPNLDGEAEFAWPKAAVKKEIDLMLPRGLLIRGKVTEEGTGRPVAGAGVRYFARGPRGTVEGEVATKPGRLVPGSPSRPARDT